MSIVMKIIIKEKDEKNINTVLFYLIVSFFIIFGLRVKFSMILATMLLAGYLVISPIDYSVYALFFFLAFLNVFKLNKESTSLYTFLQCIILLRLLIYSLDNRIYINRIIFSILLLCFSCMSTIVFSPENFSVLVRFSIVILMVSLLVSTDVIRNLSIKQVLRFYSLGIIVEGIYGKLDTFFPEIKNFLSIIYVRIDLDTISYRFSGLTANPNYYSIEITMALAALLVIYKRKKINKEFYLWAFPLSIFGIMTQSKTFIITFLIMLIQFFVICIRNNNLKTFLYSIILIMITYLCLHTFISDFSELYLSRISDLFAENKSLSSMTTGRSEAWIMYWNASVSDLKCLLLGHGLGKELSISSHNIFLEALYSLGLVGSILYYSAIVSWKNKGCPMKDIFVLAFVMFLRFFSANILTYTNTYYYLLIFIILINNYDSQNMVEDK